MRFPAFPTRGSLISLKRVDVGGSANSPWPFHTWSGAAGDFHELDLPSGRGMWVCRPTAPALVLGSAQVAEDVDERAARAAGIDIVRRRTGGGAVWVHPEDTLWVDVTIGRDDSLWQDDVSLSMLWLGRCFVEAMDRLGYGGATLNERSFDPGRWGATVCFAGAAPGEVFRDGAKVVGLSQRRGRRGARFQCLAYRRWRPAEWASVLRDSAARQAAEALEVAEIDVDVEALAGALHEVLGGVNRQKGASSG